MSYRIIYVKDVEFGSLARDFPASNDEDAREKARGEIGRLKLQHGNDILVRHLQRIEPLSDMEEKVIEISF